MKNFFQRTRSNSNAPANDAYRVWLPPADASRPAPPGPNQWIHASGQDSVRPRGEAPRSSSRARADASSVPTSSTYKYATVPPNSTGFYYPNNPGQPQSFPPPFPPQYYPPDRPDSRLGYVPYPYPNPQYPQSFTAAPPSAQPATSSRREDKKRNAGDGRRSSPVPAPAPAAERPPSSRKHSEKDDRARRPSSSSLREQKREEEAEVKKPKTKTRETSETRKRRDSQVGDSYAEKYRDQSSRKESRRDSKFRQNPRVEEGDSSDSSAQRPSSAAGYRRQLREGMRNRAQQEPIPFPAGSRVGLPLQPTAASSSSGKHTPQNPRMPVYLPTNQRRDEGQPGLSESDTDHGTLNRRRNFLRGTALGNAKQSKPSAPTPVEKKVKESKGLWPFSRSKSSQKLPQNAPPTPANIPSKKTRADSTPAKLVSTPPPP
ncbi:hypothetical protein B0H17DRAFT_248336 [Mycena rosella]|uniref:Uncharacterized protein n=1 Tax=Mycena rosella TaxID=1033263 RepID=A0AAD7MC32_MYCRO|nr:hypothetical protein B0H17DRAFT_248336 [Mycena rosella]